MGVRYVAFTPDGLALISRDFYDYVNIWDLKTGALIRSLPGPTPGMTALSPDGRTIVAGYRLWDTAQASEVRPLVNDGSSITALTYSPDGRTLLTGTSDKALKLWDVASGQRITVVSRHKDEITALAYSPDGKRIAAGDQDGVLSVWVLPAAPLR